MKNSQIFKAMELISKTCNQYENCLHCPFLNVETRECLFAASPYAWELPSEDE